MIDDPLRIAAVLLAIGLVAGPYAFQYFKFAWQGSVIEKDYSKDIHAIVSIATRLKDRGESEAAQKARELIALLLGGKNK
jgi:hypothetical protein